MKTQECDYCGGWEVTEPVEENGIIAELCSRCKDPILTLEGMKKVIHLLDWQNNCEVAA